jgi:hypothetical protein
VFGIVCLSSHFCGGRGKGAYSLAFGNYRSVLWVLRYLFEHLWRCGSSRFGITTNARAFLGKCRMFCGLSFVIYIQQEVKFKHCHHFSMPGQKLEWDISRLVATWVNSDR